MWGDAAPISLCAFLLNSFSYLEECLMAKGLDQHTHIFVDRSLDDDIMAESLVAKDEHCTNK